MKIKVKLFATLRENRFKVNEFSLDNNTRPIDILNMLNIKKEEVAILIVNGIDVKWDDTLRDGDTICIFPPVGGG